MRALTLKKLNRLLLANDQSKQLASVARLSLTDWLFFDLVLVHENIDLLGQVRNSNKRFVSFLLDFLGAKKRKILPRFSSMSFFVLCFMALEALYGYSTYNKYVE